MHAQHVSIRNCSYKLIGTLSIIQDIDLHDMCNCACAFIRDIDRNDMCKCVRVRIYERSLHFRQRRFTITKAFSWHPFVCFFQRFPSCDVFGTCVFERAEVLQRCLAIPEPGIGALLGVKQFPVCRLHLSPFCLKCLMSSMCICVRKANAI